MSEYSLDENTNQLRYINENLEEVKELLKVLIAVESITARIHIANCKEIDLEVNLYPYSEILNNYELKSSDSE